MDLAGVETVGVAASQAIAGLAPVWKFLTTRPSTTMSVGALILAFMIAFVFLSIRYGRGWRPVHPVRVLRALFAPAYVKHKSHTLDLILFVLNANVFGILVVWVVISYAKVKAATVAGLVAVLGAATAPQLPEAWIVLIATVALFLAYELGYWLDHYLCHTIPVLWEFHKVHHSAEVLSPLTNSRVHPVDSIVFANILALTIGTTMGVLSYLFGKTAQQFSLFDLNVIFVVFVYAVVQLQHSHVWIPFTGLLGKLLLSPAHHQIHHSSNPAHFNRNFGSCLAVFDWVFGTLHVPSRQREKLVFGVGSGEVSQHSPMEGLVTPFVRAAAHVAPAMAAAVSRLRRMVGTGDRARRPAASGPLAKA